MNKIERGTTANNLENFGHRVDALRERAELALESDKLADMLPAAMQLAGLEDSDLQAANSPASSTGRFLELLQERLAA